VIAAVLPSGASITTAQTTTNAQVSQSGVTSNPVKGDIFDRITTKLGTPTEADLKQIKLKAEQGDATEQFKLGCCYEQGVAWRRTIKKPSNGSARPLSRATQRHSATWGLCYDFGWGVKKDGKEAVKWYRKSAEQGNATAQLNLGMCYVKGDGVPQDYVEASKWYNLAAAQGDKKAGQYRDNLSKQMTREQIAEAQRRASRFVARSEKGAGDGSTAQPEATDVPVGSGTGFLITIGKSPYSPHLPRMPGSVSAWRLKILSSSLSLRPDISRATSRTVLPSLHAFLAMAAALS
jgi:hypothetical protein